jgi:hypothetical protein
MYALFITRTKEVGELTVRPGVKTYKKQLSYRGEILAGGFLNWRGEREFP